ncbi:MAG: 2,3-bisphosphoglycerate-independent phosphoglycerate mutase [Proteobacteria bacterium]|nr:2,3-bisphosphoglycerate-independent phosphoglycerate mutase [Pseudomonadota bacterium]
MSDSVKPMVLIILDGWGHREQSQYNPTKNAHLPTLNYLFTHYPCTYLEASGRAVGLPKGQIGNSEVGHLHLGAGREVPQDLTRISDAVANSSFKKNPAFDQAIALAKKNNSTIHIMGLVSPGGVHSHVDQIMALIKLLGEQGVQQCLHAFLDGRDVPPRSAKNSLEQIEKLFQKLGTGQIASIIGRYYAMDRDNRWERTQIAYDLLTLGQAKYSAASAVEGLAAAYARNENDEFVQATLIHSSGGQPTILKDGDIVIFMNFRADRARQLCFALTDPQFNRFTRAKFPKLAAFITLTEYSPELQATVAYPPLSLNNTLGEFLSQQGLTQLRIAETEKYAHVTYFLNGGNETPFANEDRVLIPSPKVPTYDLKPEMSAIELTDKLVSAIANKNYDVIICNYANPDMVGHTGVESAANSAVETIDQCILRIWESLKKVGGELLLTSDHGNVELMFDEKNHQPHTAHTTNLVPFLYVGRTAKWRSVDNPSLMDVAPTLIYLLGLAKPQEMTGRNLLVLEQPAY